MAGFLGTERQWRKFEKRVTKLFNRFRVDVFHTVDVRRSDKDFEGWSVDRKIEFLDEFQHIINDTLELGVASIIKSEDYDYYRNLSWGKVRRDLKYTILFRACLSQVIDYIGWLGRDRLAAEPRLRIVLEAGHSNAGDALRVYDWARRRVGPAKALAGLEFGEKRGCLPLAAADLFAYTAWGKEVGQKPIGISRKVTKADGSYRGNYFKIELDRGVLYELFQQAIALKP